MKNSSSAKKSVAIQGGVGSNHHRMATLLMPNIQTNQIAFCDSFQEVFDAVKKNKSQKGLIAIENTIAGSIAENFDLLLSSDLQVVAEASLRIHHCLISHPGAKLQNLKRVFSHPMALWQCRDFLRKNSLVEKVFFDTAAAVEYIKARNNKAEAAIAPKLAAEMYQMQVLSDDIQTNSQNITRFLVLGNKLTNTELAPKQNTRLKGLLYVRLNHEPGALAKFLTFLAVNQLNLTKVESRPIPGEPWHYAFHIDFVSSQSKKDILEVLDRANKEVEYLRIFGLITKGETFQ